MYLARVRKILSGRRFGWPQSLGTRRKRSTSQKPHWAHELLIKGRIEGKNMKKSLYLKELDYLIAWVLFFICATIGGAVAGAIGGGIIGGLLGVLHASNQTIRAAAGVLGFLLALP